MSVVGPSSFGSMPPPSTAVKDSAFRYEADYSFPGSIGLPAGAPGTPGGPPPGAGGLLGPDRGKSKFGGSGPDARECMMMDLKDRVWLDRGLKVRVIDESSKHYRKKAVIRKVFQPRRREEEAEADLELLDDKGELIRDSKGNPAGQFVRRVRQEHLETVLSKKTKLVQIVIGSMQGQFAELVSKDASQNVVQLRLKAGWLEADETIKMRCDDVCEYI